MQPVSIRMRLKQIAVSSKPSECGPRADLYRGIKTINPSVDNGTLVTLEKKLLPSDKYKNTNDDLRNAVRSLPAKRKTIARKQAKGLEARGVPNAFRVEPVAYIKVIRQTAPALVELFEQAVPEVAKRPLADRSTDELLNQIDAGRFLAEIARFWNVPAGDLAKWIAADADRSRRVKLARKNQAALWDWAALQVLLHAPSDRVEIARAEKIALHCRWRAEALGRDDYGQNIKLTQVDERNARELTTRELEIIALGGLMPG